MEENYIEESGFIKSYQFVEDFTTENGYLDGSVALNVVRELLSESNLDEFLRALDICHMLIDLQIGLPHEEGDIIISAALCSALPDIMDDKELEEQLIQQFGINERALRIARAIHIDDDMSEEEQKKHFEMIQKDRLSLLAVLADRGNLIGKLHSVSSWNAHRYISETRAYYFPMCIYAREHYPELLGPVSVLMEKMKCLIEVAEVLLRRYESRENELTQEIFALEQENAVFKAVLRGTNQWN